MKDVTRHPVERLIDWAAPATLALCCGWSAWTIAGMSAGVAAGALAMLLGVLAMHILGRGRETPQKGAFEPLPFEAPSVDELLLDDPLIDVEQGSRVVRLFDRQQETPGELVARIEGYLATGRRQADSAAAEGSAAPPDATAALHAALANIRASLR
jgi:hypothetical protein